MSIQVPVPPTATVAVVGAGFSGVLTAIHLLKRSPGVTVRLIEQADRFGPGRAYAAANAAHRLNVRAANMSAFPDRPDHFTAWLAAAGQPSCADAFVSRGRYGEYLQGLLREAMGEDGHPGRLLLEQDEAVAAEPHGPGWRVRLAVGRSLDVDAVVLAVGLGPPRAVPGATAVALVSPRYVADPWSVDPDDLPAGDILLVGCGLTMVDVALTLARPDRRLVAVSRRGLLPRRHAPTAPAQIPPGPLSTPRLAMRALRTLSAETGWRSAVDGVRPLTPAIWGSWSLAERRRFLRHVRPWWDIHRHRMAPPVAEQVRGLLDAGQLEILAARLDGVDADGAGVAVRLFPRGSAEAQVRPFSAVVNCTGLSGDIAGSPILRSLAAQGRLRPDPLGLGADVDDGLRVLDASGAPAPGLYAVGPLTRASRWETVAVPDLRRQTAELAETVLADRQAFSAVST